ncbi:small, acid-soluble spore protein I [Anoxybacillus sp. B7M1]|uniref:Small, acid-soluble spore protein I n=1 Tax=Anoxybacteroides rupiense TaxID=311460 RepID=A0ABD5ITV5_9BACL|nr:MULTISPECIES: small acid-soluble spore protein SspI [Anoxybacillus]ANB57727.1 small, acid-soluble spore protein I [Anoxybacillus sp. B2M1]ANB65064.1 small, acid-soluble spore protein I [Anoxybacillus sp. B7M1]KXG11564.1 Small, acid-soluble spore protein I [Anoxybacillus sp. P3H1B]MBB3907106.1 small acid-soluble spore protein I (minor) [Anoxybacillus rupiensis]MBS2771994.1 small acid-soluble spore protein SspI [Anoxybacillus rupiensis]
MDLNLRHAVMHNVANNTKEQLEDTIMDAIQRGEEKYLPGLGVLFEAIWNHSSPEQKNDMLVTLEQAVKQ